MKKSLIIVVAAMLCLGSSMAFAWSFSEMAGAFKDSIEPSAEYTIATSGTNIRAYEWPMQSAPGYICIDTVGTDIGLTSQCVLVDLPIWEAAVKKSQE